MPTKFKWKIDPHFYIVFQALKVYLFGKYDSFLIFHDAYIPALPENHVTKTMEKKEN